MAKISKYFRVLIAQFKLSYMSAAIYRADFLLRIIRALVEIMIGIIIIITFFTQSPQILGWSQYQVLLIYGIYQFVASAVFIFCGYGIEALYRDIIYGRIDKYLISPIDSQFSASTRISYITNVFRTIFNLGIIVFALHKLQLHPQSIEITVFGLSLISALFIYYSISFSISTLSFWTYSGELFFLMENASSAMRYPIDFFPNLIRKIFTIIPLIFVAFVPAQVLLHSDYRLSLISPLVAIVTFTISRKLWHLGLKSYQSISS